MPRSPSYWRKYRTKAKLNKTKEDFDKERIQALDRKNKQLSKMSEEQKNELRANDAKQKRERRARDKLTKEQNNENDNCSLSSNIKATPTISSGISPSMEKEEEVKDNEETETTQLPDHPAPTTPITDSDCWNVWGCPCV